MEFSGFSAGRNLDYRNGILRGVQEADAAQKVFCALVKKQNRNSIDVKLNERNAAGADGYEIFGKCIECCIKGTTGG